MAYSSFGQGLDLMAPTGHNVDNSGEITGPQLVTTDRPGDLGFNPEYDEFIDPIVDDTDYTAIMNGTSGSCPIAAGVAGLLLVAAPELGYAQIFDLLRKSADRVGPDPYPTGRNDLYGNGRVNVRRAFEALNAVELCVPAPGGENCQTNKTTTATEP
ncbi:MAG: S8 family serine peptidase [Deltaproteobacteria bacterium]|nr:S8 family serine peptidase [Deltaproteobacteria bacterium]